MTDRVKKLLAILQERKYRARRTHTKMDITDIAADKDQYMQIALLMETMLQAQKPWLVENDLFGFNRSEAEFPDIRLEDGTYLSAQRSKGNTCIDYEGVMAKGMDALLEDVRMHRQSAEGEQAQFYDAVILSIEAALDMADRYRAYAKEQGAQALYEALCQVPHNPPKNFHQACVFQKFLIFTLRCNRSEHMGIGRFDQYMLPYYLADKAAGKSDEALLEILEAYFISINMDTDIYDGQQQGDNGQSLVLGGYDKYGNDMYNGLSQLCMEASMELQLIDPKINLRVNKTTPVERLEYATRMTKLGLGFPQYCNDDVVVPGLIALGYSEEDAYNYAVAACWEFIIPGKGLDMVNIHSMKFPLELERALKEDLLNCDSFAAFMTCVKQKVYEACQAIIKRCNERSFAVSPYLSVLIQDCIGRGKDVYRGGAIYNNFGVHGVGIATAANSLMAVKQLVFDEKFCTAQELLQALEDNFEGHEVLRNRMLSCPQMGNNDDQVDDLAWELMDCFSENIHGKPNNKGGVFRAGTGTAQGMVYTAEKVGATPDGRKARDFFGSNFSPSLHSKVAGPLSCIQSFTKYDLKKAINGGPLTLEIHDTVFRHEGGIQKVAALVRAFIQLGGHQLQLNAVNRERLLDAQKNPQNYPNLIVRVWGWSGYFVELDQQFQDHIIRRTEFSV
ncbi:MAG: pyruvate formate-lyase [Oscillospiraceae bacterium]|nr:pyruvate formate-lyase [Oscillospiraceae bacterium]